MLHVNLAPGMGTSDSSAAFDLPAWVLAKKKEEAVYAAGTFSVVLL